MQKKEHIDFKTSTGVIPISTMAQILDVHQRTLRIYDKVGILTPERSQKNRRHYSMDDIERGKVVLFLTRNLALNLAGVKVILAILDDKRVNPKDYLNYVTKIAKSANIDELTQETNIEKTSRRGRKPLSAKA